MSDWYAALLQSLRALSHEQYADQTPEWIVLKVSFPGLPKPFTVSLNATLIERGWHPEASALPRRHSPDYRSVLWDNELYTFSETQAACIKVLWEALEQGTPEVGAAAILEAADSTRDRLDHAFTGHQAWGRMIVPGSTRGTFRLAP